MGPKLEPRHWKNQPAPDDRYYSSEEPYKGLDFRLLVHAARSIQSNSSYIYLSSAATHNSVHRQQ